MNGEKIYEEFIESDLSNFMGEGFEDISYDFFEKLNKEEKLPGFVYSYGRWWGNNPYEKKEEEIDLVGEGKDFSIYGEFKWRNRDFDVNDSLPMYSWVCGQKLGQMKGRFKNVFIPRKSKSC